MELDVRALPLTRRQLEIWLAQETGQPSREWQLSLFVKIGGMVDRDALKRAICQGVREAETSRAGVFEVDGQVFQKAIDYPEIELDFYDLTDSDHAVQAAETIASAIQRTPMPLSGPLFRFALFQTRPDECYWFTRSEERRVGKECRL